MKGVRFHDSKLKLVKALLFRSFDETEAPTAGFCSPFICGRAYMRTNPYLKWNEHLFAINLYYQIIN